LGRRVHRGSIGGGPGDLLNSTNKKGKQGKKGENHLVAAAVAPEGGLTNSELIMIQS